MTSTKNPTPPIKKEIQFPRLMEYEDGSFIVLFAEATEGIVAWSEYDIYPVGNYSRAWNNIKDTCWIPYEGSITLKN